MKKIISNKTVDYSVKFLIFLFYLLLILSVVGFIIYLIFSIGRVYERKQLNTSIKNDKTVISSYDNKNNIDNTRIEIKSKLV